MLEIMGWQYSHLFSQPLILYKYYFLSFLKKSTETWHKYKCMLATFFQYWIFSLNSITSHQSLRLSTGPQMRVHNWKLFFLFLSQNICCGYSKEPSHRGDSFEHPKHMFKLMEKKIIAIVHNFFFGLTGPMLSINFMYCILNFYSIRKGPFLQFNHHFLSIHTNG